MPVRGTIFHRIVFLVVFFLLGFPLPAVSAGKWMDQDVPRFTAVDLEGRQVLLSEVLGRSRAVVVNFWGVRCKTCIDEMPFLADLATRYGARGLQVIGVNADGISKEKIRETLPQIGITPSYPLVCDPEFKVMDAFGVTATPFTLVIRPDGKVTYEHVGFASGDERTLESEIRKLVDPTSR
jgi:cytochrome c biogenesis protein CcmG/thiol:disulfide interchange protein DsbE